MTPEVGAEIHESRTALYNGRMSVGEIWVWLSVLCSME